MKGKIKNLLEKIKKFFLVVITLAIYIYGFLFVRIAFGVMACILVSVCALATIVIPLMFGTSIVEIIKQGLEYRNSRQEMLNDLLKSLEEQHECTTQEVEVVQKIENQNGNLDVEEHIPYDDKTLEKLKETIEKDENSINRTNALKVMDNYELAKYKVATAINKEELIELKHELTLLSFQLQDIAARYNADKTIEEIYNNREDLIRLRTNRNIVNKE